MFLKRLDIVGFKSFAERVSIDFVKGVTAVVGPNGSGKSNITDAIRWVLGEQSIKNLRGGKMEDIIFAGSETRKPLNFAEVSVTLDNEDHFLPLDYNEICITRRVYRTGDSEFFINKQPCRLKDIHDLLMDSGLGKEAFSIIGQGRVEEILNSKAEDRRSIFEEAAGVLKYKTRKKKAEMKLVETEENLNRVRDILHELKGQLEPLKRQASVAKEYLAKKDELKTIEVSLLAHEIQVLHEKWDLLKKELETHKDKELELSNQIQVKETEILNIRNQTAGLDETIEQLQNELLITSEELEKLSGKKEVLKERKKNAIHNKEQLQKSIVENKERLKELETEIRSLTEERDKSIRALEEVRALLKEKEQEIAIFAENIDDKIEKLKGDYIELLNEQAAINNDEHHLDGQLGQIEQKRLRLLEENKRSIEEREGILQEKATLVEKLKKQEQVVNEKIDLFRLNERKLESLRHQYEKSEKNLYQGLQYIQQAKSRKELLEEMEDDYTGFYQGVREVLKARKQLPGIIGAVSELLTVEKQFETAISVALGASLQHIVVETEDNARKAIQYLKQNGFGRATFLPLSVMKAKEIPVSFRQNIEHHPDFIGIGAELVTAEGKYKQIVQNLLGNVIISKDLRGANSLAKILQYRYRIVTLDGDVVNPGGSMTGGSIKQNSGHLLTRKSELEDLKTKLAKMEEKAVLLEQDVKAKKQELKKKEEELVFIQEEINDFRQEEQLLKDELKDIEWREKNINNQLSLFDQEIKDLKREETELLKRKEENAKKLQRIKESIEKLDDELKLLSEKKNMDQSSKAELQERIQELKIQLVKREEQLASINSQWKEKQARYDELRFAIEESENALKILLQELESSSYNEIDLEKEAKLKNEMKNKILETISEKRKERLDLQQKLEDLELEAKELKRQHKGLSDLLKEEEVKVNRLDVELDNLLATLREEYTLTFEAAIEQYPLTIPYNEAKKQVRLIKLAIEELGTVNLGAIEEYERVSERFQFLTEQKEDLQEAKSTLYQVIDEMDEVMIERFDDTFQKIRSEFNNVFAALFGGGRAELKLTDPEDLLNTGIEIIAQPPGKKLQNLALLSGGERALTAIALLFSILKVRPVPFCVLDEVEAALDEANVYRFIHYLKQFSDETQFIVITHRKGTMEESDVLYGVTMQESGVSRLVSVRLEEVEQVVS